MAMADMFLYWCARLGSRTEIAHTDAMKQSLESADSYDHFRAAESNKMLAALAKYGSSVVGKTVVDFGCNDGAMSVAYLNGGAKSVIGVDIDTEAIARARRLHSDSALTFIEGSVDS